MTLSFPNASRSFDKSQNAVRFAGHEGLFEVAFLIPAAVLVEHASNPDKWSPSEATLLGVFDVMRERIYNVARRVYAGQKKSLYVLSDTDFR